VSLLVVGRLGSLRRREGDWEGLCVCVCVCVQVYIGGVGCVDFGGVGVRRRGWFACGIACAVFKCIMRLGVWLAIECDAVGDGKCVTFIIILLSVHTWNFCSGRNCVDSGGVKTCCS
jgi:hypothetical protein